MNVWRNCGHPRTPENTKLHGNRKGKPLVRCRICRQKIERRSIKNIRAARKIDKMGVDQRHSPL